MPTPLIPTPRARLLRRWRHHHPTRRTLRGHGYFKRLGPGLVTGAADDDPSGIGTYSQVGAAFGLALSWSALAVGPLAIAVQELAARIGLVSAQGLGVLMRRRFPKLIVLFAVLLVAIANTFNIAADLQAMGAATAVVAPVNPAVWTVGFALVIVTLEVFVPYHRYSKILRWLALSLGAYLVVLFMVNADWLEVLRAALIPTFSGTRGELIALIAVFGTTISPYLFFWQASEEVEEEGEVAPRATPDVRPQHLTAMRVDVIGGMVSAVLIAFAIIVASALTLHPAGITQINTPAQAAEALQPIAGNLAGAVFALGIVGLGLLAVPVLAGATAYAVAEVFGWHEGLSSHFRQARGFYTVILLSMAIGLALGFGGLDPIRGLYYAAILNGVCAPPLIVLMMILARDKRIMGEHRSGWLSLTITGAAAFIAVGLIVTAGILAIR
ncbi:MAG: NRAMP family divalent metal transporter [Acidimicrobiia bacterium]